MAIKKHSILGLCALLVGGGWVVGVDQFGISPSGVVGTVWFIFMVVATVALAHVGGVWILGEIDSRFGLSVPEFIEFFVPYVIPYLVFWFLVLNFEPPAIFAVDCSPDYHWREGYEETTDPQYKDTPAAFRYLELRPNSKRKYSMHILGAEDGLDNLNAWWLGAKKEDGRKWTKGGINLQLRHPVGLVEIRITPLSMANTPLQISFECLSHVSR